MSLFPRFTQEFAPLFRLMDDYERSSYRNLSDTDASSPFQALRSFTPKFDVQEHKDAYELQGEFPGIEQKDINIEWTDSNTLTISGRHEHVREEGTRPKALLSNSGAGDKDKAAIKDKQPRVEDEVANNDSGTTVAKSDSNGTVANKNQQFEPKTWVSERSVGEFHRSFAFPQRVDQDAVKASLKNGILSVVVPKAKAQTPRKIAIDA